MKETQVKKVDVVVLDSPLDVLGLISRPLPKNTTFTVFETDIKIGHVIQPFLSTRGRVTYCGESIPKCLEQGTMIVTMELGKLTSQVQKNINKIIYI